MSPLRRAAAVLLTLLVAGAGAVPAGAADEGSAGTGMLLLQGTGDRQTYHETLALPEGRFGAASGPDHASFWAYEQGTYSVSLFVGAPSGSRLEPGRFPTTSDRTPGTGYLTLDSGFWSCTEHVGTVDVLEVERDELGWVSALAFDYSRSCDGGPPTSGSVRWSSDVPFAYSTSSGVDVVVPVWTTYRDTVVVTNHGSAPQTYGASTWRPRYADMPSTVLVEQDRCAGTTVPPGGTCTVDVAVPYRNRYGTAGYLHTADESPRGASYAAITVGPVDGPRPTPDGAEGTYVPVAPVRVLDTRTGLGGRAGALGPGGQMTFAPGLGGAVPRSGVSAVMLNVTGTEPTVSTHVRVWPGGTPVPGTSSLNLAPRQDRANQVVVPVGADGTVALYNHRGSTHLVVDVQGYYSDSTGLPGGEYHLTEPARVLDTRDARRPLRPGEVLRLPLGATGLDEGTVEAVDVNVTVTEPTTAGHLTAWAGGGAAPDASTVNFAPGQTVANHAVVPVSIDRATGEPYVALRNSNGLTHVVVDVQGWYDDGSREDGLRFAPSPTERVADTRQPGSKLAAGGTVQVRPWLLPDGAAHVVNVTATESFGPGHLTAWSGEGPLPGTSTVNFAAREDAANLATVPTGPWDSFSVTTRSSDAHVVIDHLGYFW